MRRIRAPRTWRASPLVGLLALACAGEQSTPVDPVSLSAKPRTISGRVLGPDGKNICNSLGSGTLVVQLLNPEFGSTSGNPFLGRQELSCPRNNYSLAVDSGVAFLRVTLPIPSGQPAEFGAMPWRHLDVVEVLNQSVDHDLDVRAGTQVGGSATLDGQRFEGVFLQVGYEFNGAFGATNGLSDTLGPTGTWREFFGRAPMILQNGVRYSVFSTCGGMLGTRLISFLENSSFQFPEEVSAFQCTLETGTATRFSHTATRVVVTPLPGDIGGSFSNDFFDRYGVGWGVQFPVDPGSSPQHDPGFSEIFNGGLLIGIGPDQVLAGADAGSMMPCGATCRDLGLNGMVKFTTKRDGTKSVTWRYSDATSAEAAGLEVTQVSTDGKRPNDYVLFRFSIRNIRTAAVTFYAGTFGDWDVDLDAGDDLGATDLGGKLMYQVSAIEPGVHVGTVVLGAPVTGNFFFDGSLGAAPSTADQVQALSGGVRQETAGPGDLRYIQGAGPITLQRGQAKDIWVAVVVGQDKAELLANAAAAEADFTSKAGSPLDVTGLTLAPVANSSRTRTQTVCKNCSAR